MSTVKGEGWRHRKYRRAVQRYARLDAQLEPLKCDHGDKVIYPNRMSAAAAALAMEAVGGRRQKAYPCPLSPDHYHLRTQSISPMQTAVKVPPPARLHPVISILLAAPSGTVARAQLARVWESRNAKQAAAGLRLVMIYLERLGVARRDGDHLVIVTDREALTDLFGSWPMPRV